MPFISDKDLLLRANSAFNTTERNNINNIWEDISTLITPIQSGNYSGETSKGERKSQKIYDITAVQAVKDLANAIQSTVTPQSSEWAKIEFSDDAINNDKDATEWLASASTSMHRYINSSNFNSQMSKAFNSYASIGTMVLLCEDSKDKNGVFNGLYFKAIHMSEVAIEENKYGLVDTVYRKFKLTAKQVYQSYKNVLPKNYFNTIDATSIDEEIEFIHAVYPNDDKSPSKESAPFLSKLFDSTRGNVVESDFYQEMPYLVVRWETAINEVYGRSPSFIALPLVSQLNYLQRVTLQVVERTLSPPMFVQNSSLLSKLNLNAGAITVTNDINNSAKEFLTQGRVDIGQFEVNKTQEDIKKLYFLDKLLLPPRQDTGEMTAYEVQQRQEQMQKVLGAVLSNINNELLAPLVARVLGILERNKVIEEFNPNLEAIPENGKTSKGLGVIDVNVVFENSLVRSQRNEEVSNIQNFMNYVAENLSPVSPQALDYVNSDEIVKYIANARDIPPNITRTDKEVKDIRDARQKQQELAQQMEMATKQADIQSKTGGSNGQQQQQ